MLECPALHLKPFNASYFKLALNYFELDKITEITFAKIFVVLHNPFIGEDKESCTCVASLFQFKFIANLCS